MKHYTNTLIISTLVIATIGVSLAVRQIHQRLLKAQEERQCRMYVLDSMEGVIQVFNHVKKRHPESIEEAQEWGRKTFDYIKEPDYCKIHSKKLIADSKSFKVFYKADLQYVRSAEGTYTWEMGENSETYLWMYTESVKK